MKKRSLTNRDEKTLFKVKCKTNEGIFRQYVAADKIEDVFKAFAPNTFILSIKHIEDIAIINDASLTR